VHGKGKLALVTDNGGPLYFIDPYANGGKGKRWCKIETDLLALRLRLKIKSVTFDVPRHVQHEDREHRPNGDRPVRRSQGWSHGAVLR
jgi:hypothetical protein